MKVAALDLGTNSFLCLIADVENGAVKKIHADEVRIVRLGQGVNQSKKFHPDALARAENCLSEFKSIIDQHKPDRILAMATSAARDVTNQDELFKIGRKLAIPMEIIPGEREAEISFSGSVSGFPKDNKVRAVIDVGGGSTEIIVGQSGKVLFGESVNIGAVRMTEMFPTIADLPKLIEYCESKLKPLGERAMQFHPQEVLGTAGTPTELMAAQLGGFDAQKIDGSPLSDRDLGVWVERFIQTTAAERVQRFGISEGRADVILAGTKILQLALQTLRMNQLTVVTRGIRFGVALELSRR